MRTAAAPTGGAARRTRSCSGSTAPPGSPASAQDEYLHLLEEAEKRDHRKLGARARPVLLPDRDRLAAWPVFHPKGGVIRRVHGGLLAPAARARRVTSFVNTPHITKADLFETSGHLDWYADGMFPPMELEGANYYLKPMNCPMHILIYRSRGRSYRELPLRLFEFGTVYRYEKSGRGARPDPGPRLDPGRRAHLLHPRADAATSSQSLLRFVLGLLRDYGLDDFYLELSTRTRSKFVGTDEDWDEATEALRRQPPVESRPASSIPGGAARSTGRRSPCRPRTRSAAPGSCRPSRSTSTCRSGSSSSTRPPTAPGSGRS